MAEGYPHGSPSLAGVRLKLARANEHLDELEPELRAYSNPNPYRITEQPHVEGDWKVHHIDDARQPDPAWGVRVGEFLHDLRSALDNLVWQLVLVNGQEPGDQNQFPIFWRNEPAPGRLDRMLAGVSASHRAAIEELQPYTGLHVHSRHKRALVWLAVLNNIDKHRTVHPAVGVREQGETPTARHLRGPEPEQVEINIATGPIYDGAEAFRWRVIGGAPDTEVEVEGSVPHDVAFGDPRVTLGGLDWIRECVAEIVGRFAPDFP